MNVRFYMDVHVPRAVTTALRLRGVDDDALLLRAAALARVLVTQDEDLLREGARFLRTGIEFAGVVYGHQMLVDIGRLVEDLTLIASVSEPDEWAGRICYLPL
ncbi:MAG: hypothetical protein HY820_33350 [Acidobacteria bacterium]|nr:hypothetical protein [Acidobacteriota bacterium]